MMIAILIKPLVAAFCGFCGYLYSGFPIETRNVIGRVRLLSESLSRHPFPEPEFQRASMRLYFILCYPLSAILVGGLFATTALAENRYFVGVAFAPASEERELSRADSSAIGDATFPNNTTTVYEGTQSGSTFTLGLRRELPQFFNTEADIYLRSESHSGETKFTMTTPFFGTALNLLVTGETLTSAAWRVVGVDFRSLRTGEQSAGVSAQGMLEYWSGSGKNVTSFLDINISNSSGTSQQSNEQKETFAGTGHIIAFGPTIQNPDSQYEQGLLFTQSTLLRDYSVSETESTDYATKYITRFLSYTVRGLGDSTRYFGSLGSGNARLRHLNQSTSDRYNFAEFSIGVIRANGHEFALVSHLASLLSSNSSPTKTAETNANSQLQYRYRF